MRAAPLSLSLLLALPVHGCREAPPPPFDGERAMADLRRQVDFGPRIPGSPGHAGTAEWLLETLAPLAADVTADHFEAAGMQLVNIHARLGPEVAERVLLLAHWDTRPHADMDPDPSRRGDPVAGANDGASGTAVLLELARMFDARPPEVGIDLVLVDGEDQGQFVPPYDTVLLGSRRLAATWQGPRPRFGILLDMVGDRDLRIRPEALSRACCPRTLDAIWGAARELGHGAVFVDEPAGAIIDDHVPLNEAGLGVVDLIDFEYDAWHTTADTPERTSARSLQIVGEVVAAVVYRERRR